MGRLVLLDVIEVEVLVDANMPDDEAEALRQRVRADVSRTLAVDEPRGVKIRVR